MFLKRGCMYRQRKKLFVTVINALVLIFSVLFSILLVFQNTSESYVVVCSIIPFVVFLTLLVIGSASKRKADEQLLISNIQTGDTKLIVDFIERLRFCYSLENLYKAIAETLELEADSSVLFIDRAKNYVLYNSPDRLSSLSTTRDKVAKNFSRSWKEGIYFLGSNFGIVSSYKHARGFFLCSKGHHFFVFNRYTRLFDLDIYEKLFEEYERFLSRRRIIEKLSEISSLTKEWEQLAATQVSFLPHTLPDIPHLKIAAYYRPLVNVSGDYYSVLPISESKTLLMLGDVSGKGLPAALIMGLVMNTVKIKENKEDLTGLIYAVDRAIKEMHLQDKYTVLFLGIVDTDKMRISYINASMSDPIILSRSPDGYRIKSLSSNASLVGIIDMGDVSVAEHRLFRGDTIVLATDGVSEVMDENGVELGDTDMFKKQLKASAAKQPQQMVDDIVNLIMGYNGSKRLHDDITMMVAKVG